MSNLTIPDYTLANTIDPAQDLFLMWQNSTNTYKSINRNTILGVPGTPVDTISVQTLQNKILDNTNTITLKDSLFTLQDNGDTTKQAQFQLSGITTATTRTYTLPNASSTLADISTTQTFTNKSLTSPTITGGSVTNVTLSVDSVSEYTTNNGVTVDGLNIKDGKLNSSNSVVTSNLTDSAVTPAKLLAGTGTGWAWQTYTPTLAIITIGNGTIDARYAQIGKTVIVRFRIVFGSTSSMGTGFPSLTLPVTANSSYTGNWEVGTFCMVDPTVSTFAGMMELASTTACAMVAQNVAGTFLTASQVSSTTPFTWANAYYIAGTFTYEAA